MEGDLKVMVLYRGWTGVYRIYTEPDKRDPYLYNTPYYRCTRKILSTSTQLKYTVVKSPLMFSLIHVHTKVAQISISNHRHLVLASVGFVKAGMVNICEGKNTHHGINDFLLESMVYRWLMKT